MAPEDGVATFPLPAPPSSFSTSRRVGAAVGGFAQRGIVEVTGGLSVDFDLGFLLPEISAVTVDDTDPERPVVALVGSLGGTDLGLVRLSWQNGENSVVWHLVLPTAETTSVKFPALPSDLEEIVPENATASNATAVDHTGAIGSGAQRAIRVRALPAGQEELREAGPRPRRQGARPGLRRVQRRHRRELLISERETRRRRGGALPKP